MLRDVAWLHRHRLITRFAILQSVGLAFFALLVGRLPADALLAFLVPGVPALMGLQPRLSRTARTLSTVSSLMFASATLVDLTGGLVEAHFHFFVMVGVVSLYQDWAAFGVCVLITVLHHAVMGIGAPSSVYSGADQQHPIRWAIVHGAFILAASVTHMIAWKLNEQQELRDPLTQLPNRSSFNQRLDQVVAGGLPVAVLFIDIDNFKSINDSGGHHAGDVALAHAARVMTENVRAGDLVSRLGGDEFAVLVRGDVSLAREVATRIATALSLPLSCEGRDIFVSVSIGVVDDVLAGSRVPETLLSAADRAMYVAKKSGRGLVVTYSASIQEKAEQKATLTKALGLALDAGQFHLHYQPLIDTRTERMFGVEALLRWDHPELGRISPEDFVPLAEETGDIVPLGSWVLLEACRRVALWQQDMPGCGDLNLSVNLSAPQLRDPELLTHLTAALSESGLAASSLTLEVTETSMLADLDLASRQLEAVRALGVAVAIDDFGTGYSSLSYLARLPADKVKIDQSFVADLVGEPTALALVRCILDMARALDLEVLAEGVETAEQLTVLTSLGCRWSQGYLWSRPLPPDELAAFATRQAAQTDLRPTRTLV